MRNPNWHRDEIILALDLYFQLNPGQIHNRNPKIIELSKILNLLPIHSIRPDKVKFRNPNGVGLKLSNILAVDGKYHGDGMKRGGKLDKIVFNEFKDRKEELHKIAERIKRTVANQDLNHQLYQIPNDEPEIITSVFEGQVIYKLHKYRERDARIIKQKKEHALDLTGKLECEACKFDFEKGYGKKGRGFIECHHKHPLSEIKVEQKTTLDDLILICPNCHKIVHRGNTLIDIITIKEMINFEHIYRNKHIIT